MRFLDGSGEFIEPFIEHQGERRGFWLRKVRPVGERILIAARGVPIPVSHGGKAVIRLDFNGAFGTGGHGTTEGCLVALEERIRGGETVLDAGTGTGILAIAAHKLGAGSVTAVDIDRAACAAARKNLSLNGITGGIDVVEGGIGSVTGPFDVVAANLRTPVLVELAGDIHHHLKGSGVAILSGILERELHPFLSFLGTCPLEPVEMKRIRGWMTLVLKKRSTFPTGW